MRLCELSGRLSIGETQESSVYEGIWGGLQMLSM